MNKKFFQEGFTLIELAIVLVVIGFLIGSGISLMGLLIKRAKLTSTKELISSSIDAVVSFASSHGKLPKGGEFEKTVRSTTDSFGKDILYIADRGLVEKKTVCGSGRTNLEVHICQDSSCSDPRVITNVAYIVLSGGENHNIQTYPHGSFNVQTRNVVLVSNGYVNVYQDGTENIDDCSADILRRETYDDIVRWITLDELRIKAGCKGPPLKIINTELPSGYEGSSYDAAIYAEGGVPFDDGSDPDSEPDYKWCWSGSLPPGLSVKCGGTLAKSGSCSEGGIWGICTSPKITGIPESGSSGIYKISLYVSDNDNNVFGKSFAITVNPSAGAGPAPGPHPIPVPIPKPVPKPIPLPPIIRHGK